MSKTHKTSTETQPRHDYLDDLEGEVTSPKLVGYITVIKGLADMAIYSDSPNLSEHLANPTFRTHDGESSLGCQP